MNNKIKDFITVFLIQLVLTIPFYTVNVYAIAISNAQITRVTASSATIEWDTDAIANGAVKYGKTASLGYTQRHDNFVFNHTVALFNGIEDDTAYFFSVESRDLNGTTAVDNNSNSFYTFRTTDITAPPQGTGLMVLSRTSNSIFLSWNALNISDFSYFIVERNGIPIANTTATSFNDTNLPSGTIFNYKVSAVDTSGNIGPKSNIVTTSTLGIDSTNPLISSIEALPVTDTTERINWLTDENSTSTVFFGINTTNKVKNSNDLVTNHSIVIDGLVKSVTYVFIVQSCDASKNCANSSVQSFTAGRDLTPPFINLSIPRFVNRRVIDVIGSTEPFTSVTLFVNDMTVPKRSLSNNEVGSSGKFIFAQVQLEQENIIKAVFVDRSGNRNERTFEVTVDTELPVVQLNDVPSLTSKINVTFKGTVNEPAVIKVFVEPTGNLGTIPSKIEGLNATKIGQNSVEIHWKESEDKDFSHYVVYRKDASPIAVTKPADFNLFIDALVDSGRSYTYQVSAVNIFANEGPKSDPIIVTTLSGGSVLGINPPDVDIFAIFKKPFLLINITGSFNFGILLNKGDGVYKVRLVFEDRAGNSVVLERTITLDTKKPEITITSPPQGAFVFENVAHEIDVVGKTKPNARVHLFIDRTPFSFFNETLELSGLPNEVQGLPESQLDAKCRSQLVASSFCRTGADFSVRADEQGNFKFENVDLTAVFGGAARLSEVSPSQLANAGGNLNQDARQSKTTTLVVIATGQAGLRGVKTQTIRIGNCWSGNQSWDIIPMIQYQSPTFLSTERMADGTETVYFYLNYSYIGPGTNAKISRVNIIKACSSRELVDPRFNISCLLMPAGNVPKLLNPPENTISYSAMPLSRLPGMERFLEKDWKGFFKAMNNEVTFPLRIQITYQHDKNNDGKLETEVQTTCEQVSYVLDKSIIDPRKVLPDWLLFDFVDFLQNNIKTLDSVQVQLNQLLQYVMFGCITSWGLNIVLGVYRRWVSFYDEKFFLVLKDYKDTLNQLQQIQSTNQNENNQDNKKYCDQIEHAIAQSKQGFRLKYLSDADLKKCFPNTAAAWDTEAKAYQFMRWSCDRIFGHSTPSAWTEEKSDKDIFAKIDAADTCKKDQGDPGKPLRAMSCTDFARQYARFSSVASRGADAKCMLVPTEKGAAVYQLDGKVEGSDNLYKFSHIKIAGELAEENMYAVRANNQDEVNYLTAQPRTCAEVCGAGKVEGTVNEFKGNGGESVTISTAKEGEQTQPITPQEKTDEQTKREELIKRGKDLAKTMKISPEDIRWDTIKPTGKNGQEISEQDIRNAKKEFKGKLGGCATKSDCTSFNKDQKISFGGNAYKIDYAYSAGFTKGCFYTPGKEVSVVSENPAQRVICCCINAKKEPEKIYYQPNDKVWYADIIKDANPENVQAHQRKEETAISQVPIVNQIKLPDLTETDFNKMDWSYRYYKERFETFDPNNPSVKHFEYNPKRYISGRDLPACFGMDNWFYVLAEKPENEVIINPAQEHWPAIQCAHVTGINNRITMLKNFMTATSTCLIQVRTTGKADAGVCKELFTQYLCSSIWQFIRFFVDGCTQTGIGEDKKLPEELTNYIAYVRGGLKGIYEGVNDLQSTLTSEYGNTKLNELFGLGEESIARQICLFAFGYDWNLNFKNFIDAAYSTPFATFVQAVTRSREFLTVEPGSLKPKYEYRASWLINPGCNFERYNVYLSCVGQRQINKYPNDVNCGALGAPSIAYTGKTIGTGPSPAYSQCDCTNLPDERRKLVYSGKLTQNKLEDIALPAGQRVVTEDVRYDHIMFELITDRKIPANIKPNCFPAGYDDGRFYFPLIDKTARDIFDCRADPASGSFVCGQGQAFGAKKGTANFLDLKLNGIDAARSDIVLSAGDTLFIDTTIRNVGKEKCLKATLDGQSQAIIIREGIQQYNLPIAKALTIGTVQGITASQGVGIEAGNSQNSDDVTIALQFYDMDSNNNIDFNSEDIIEVRGIGFVAGKNIADNAQTLGTGDDAVQLVVTNGQLIARKKQAEVKILSAQIARNINGVITPFNVPQNAPDPSRNSDMQDNVAKKQTAGAAATIQIKSQFQTAPTTTQMQPKILEIGLFNIGDDVETADENFANCKFNDPVAGSARRLSFRVEQKPTGITRGAVVSSPTFKPSKEIKKDQSMEISVRIVGNDRSKNVFVQCITPDVQTLNPAVIQNGEIYTFSPGPFSFAGTYKCKITAPSTDPKANAGEGTANFEVFCGDGTGKCNTNGDCIIDGRQQNNLMVTPCQSTIQQQQITIERANDLLNTLPKQNEGSVLDTLS